MKRKSKRKKDSNTPKTPEITKKENSNQQKGNDSQLDESGTASRSSSRRTRSLSSIFRRSRDRQRRDRSESSERSKSRGTSSGGTELSDPHGFNPRTEPRSHLRRMTVREALADSRTRGRSPNRRAIYNLEKRIMSSGHEPDTSIDNSLSASLPHIPDQIPLNDHDTTNISEMDDSRVTDSNRSGKTRGHSEGQISLNDTAVLTNNTPNKDEFLPLDKRKYIINKETASVHTDSTLQSRRQPDNPGLHQAEVHSPHSSRDPSPYSLSAFANQERQRRESFGRFLQLRDTRPPRSSSSVSIGRQSIDSQTSLDEHNVMNSVPETVQTSPSNVSVLEDGTRVTLPTYDEVMAESTLPAGRRTFNPSAASKFKPIKTKETGAIPKVKEDNGTRNNANNDKEPLVKEKERRESRSSFVSPRRFTRGSRKISDSSHMSSEANEAGEEVMVAEKVQSRPESVPRRYHRKFSSSSEKRRKISGQSDIITPQIDSNILNDGQSNIANPPAMVLGYPNEKIDSLAKTYNNEILFPKPTMPTMQDIQVQAREEGTNDNNELSDNSDLNTGLSDVANKIQEAMNTVNNESLAIQFPNDDCQAVPLDSITDDIPFKIRTNSEHESKASEAESGQSQSRSKSNSDSKKYSTNSDADLINVDNVEDILMQDDVFETNIDEISLRSEGKIIASGNHAQTAGSTETRKSSSETEKSKHGSRHSSDSDKPGGKESTKKNVPEPQKKEGKSKKESKKGKKKNVKKGENESIKDIENKNSKDAENKEADEKSEDKKRKSKKVKKERKKSKSKKSRSLSDLGSDVSKAKELSEAHIDDKHLENDKIVKLDDCKEKEPKQKVQKRKSFFRRSRRSMSRTSSVKDAIIKVGRAASLSNILDTPEMKRANRKPSLVKTDSLHRSHSVEEISTLKYNKIEPINHNIPDSIFNRRSAKDAIWNIQTQIPKSKEKKPKLSLSAIISMRAKVGRYKKSKQAKDKDETENKEVVVQDTTAAIECNEDEDQEQPNDNTEQCDKEVANIVYENEVNVSLNKQHDTNTETMIIEDDLDNEIANIVHEKKIHFESFLNEQQLSEEELIKQRQRNTRLTGRRESKVRQRQKRVISCCKKLIAFLFSHIGLCSLVVAYCIAGGFIFKNLEGSNEIEKKKEMQTVRQDYTSQIFNLAFQNRFSKRSAKEFKIKVQEILTNYSLKIYRETKEAGWDGKDSTNEPEQWSFPSSLLYAITVMTTIGYGHVAPKTPVGRIVTIGYAVLGIPLTLLCLTNIGDVMAKGFRMLYGKVFCGLCCVLFRPSRKRRMHDPERGMPAGEERMVVQEEEKSEEIIHVPTSVCLLLMSAYVLLGTWAFCEWEKWDMITGTYFCFITLSTIGFGDVVPGMTSDKWDMNEKLVLCGLYLILGLSLIAMCFNLVQEDVKAKCKWLGMKLGIIDKPVTSV